MRLKMPKVQRPLRPRENTKKNSLEEPGMVWGHFLDPLLRSSGQNDI